MAQTSTPTDVVGVARGELDGALLPTTSEGTAPEAAVEIAALSGGSAGITLGRGDGSGGALQYLAHDGDAARWLGGGLMPRAGR